MPIIRYRRSPWPEVAMVAILTFLITVIPSSRLGQSTMRHDRHTMKQLATCVARNHGVDPKLVNAVVTVESSWRPGAVSRKDAHGLMQVHLPTWGHRWTRRQLHDPEQNLIAGTKILKRYINESRDLREALVKYSGGATGYYEKVKKQMKGA